MKIDKQQHGTAAAPMAATTAATTEAPAAPTSTRSSVTHTQAFPRVAPPIIGFAHVKRPLVAATSDPGCMQEGRWRRSNRLSLHHTYFETTDRPHHHSTNFFEFFFFLKSSYKSGSSSKLRLANFFFVHTFKRYRLNTELVYCGFDRKRK